jgi:porin
MTARTAISLFIGSILLGDLLVSPAQADGPQAVSPPVNPTPAVAAPPGPFDLNVTYVGELWQNDGGLKTGTDYMQALDASLSIDMKKLFGLQAGGKFYVEGFYTAGKSLDRYYTGAEQASSAIDTYYVQGFLKLYQLYYEQQFGATEVLAGKYDIQQQFATTRPMDLFGNKGQAMNYAFFVAGQVTGPTTSIYPNTALGLRIKQTFNDRWSVKVGLLDGQADRPNGETGFEFKNKYGVLGIGEVDFTPWEHTKIMAGVWGETGEFSKLGQYTSSFAPVTTWGEIGSYVGAATRLYTIEGARGVDGFFNVGFAPGDTNIINRSYDAGLTVTGLIAARPYDKLGVAVSVAENGPGFKADAILAGFRLHNDETAYELTYRAKLTEWLTVQPDIQYIVHPADGMIKNAFVFGLHFELHNEWID